MFVRPSLPLPANALLRCIRNGPVGLAALDWPGDAPPVIIVPGITSPAATWAFVVQALELPNQVIVLDTRGRGMSDCPSSGYTLDDYTSDLHAWIVQLNLNKPILLGHSMGARVVAQLDARWPGLVGGVVAIEPPLSGPGKKPYPIGLDFYIQGIRSTRAGATLESLRASAPTWSDDRLMDRLLWLPTCSEDAVKESFLHFHDEDFLLVWSAVTAPAYLVYGEKSPVVIADDVIELQRTLPNAYYRPVPGAGHMIPWDNLPDFVATIREILLKSPHTP